MSMAEQSQVNVTSSVDEECLLEAVRKSSLWPHGAKRVTRLSIAENINHGHGFMGDVFRVKLHYINENANDDTLSLVLKTIRDLPLLKTVDQSNQYSWREVHMYSTLLPDMQKFASSAQSKICTLQRPACYLAIHGEPNILLLEDLEASDFHTIDFKRGMTISQARLAVEQLAIFHATGLAMRINLGIDMDQKYPFLYKGKEDDPGLAYFLPTAFKLLLEHLRKLEDKQWLCQKLQALQPQAVDTIIRLIQPRGPLATTIHSDSSCNNFMFRTDATNREHATACKIFDFQVSMYGKPTNDLAFLLFSSLEPELRRAEERHLLEHYLSIFIKIVHDFNAPLEAEIIRQTFQKDWRDSQLAGMLHLILCGPNWFFGRFNEPSLHQRIVAVVEDVANRNLF